MKLEIVNHSRPNSPSMNRRKFRLQFTAKGEVGWGNPAEVTVQKQPAELISSNIKLGRKTRFNHGGFQWDFFTEQELKHHGKFCTRNIPGDHFSNVNANMLHKHVDICSISSRKE